MEIRLFKEEDAEEVSTLVRRTLLEVNSKFYQEEIIDFLYNRFTPNYFAEKSKERQTYVAVDDEEILGTVSINDDWAGETYIKPEHHRKGIGTKLMRHAEKVAKEKSESQIRIYSLINSEKFYEKIGYVKCEDYYIHGKGRTIKMTKKL